MDSLKLALRWIADHKFYVAHFCLFSAEVLWGGFVVFSKYGIEGGLSPTLFVCFRCPVAFLLLFLLCMGSGELRNEFFRLPDRSEMSLVLSIGFCAFLFTAFLSYGLAMSTATNAVILEMVAIPFTALVAICTRREKFTALKAAGIIIGTLGGLIMAEVEKFDVSGEFFWGNIFLMLGGFSFSIYVILGEVAYQTMPATVLNCRSNLMATILNLLLAVSVFRKDLEWEKVASLSKMSWITIVYAGFVGMVLCGQIYSWGLKHTSAVAGAIYFPFQALSGIILAAIFLGDILTLRSVIGGVTVAAGVACIMIAQRREHQESSDSYQKVESNQAEKVSDENVEIPLSVIEVQDSEDNFEGDK